MIINFSVKSKTLGYDQFTWFILRIWSGMHKGWFSNIWFENQLLCCLGKAGFMSFFFFLIKKKLYGYV